MMVRDAGRLMDRFVFPPKIPLHGFFQCLELFYICPFMGNDLIPFPAYGIKHGL